jgi:hypothetical protein
MTLIRLVTAPIRRLVNFSLFQLAVVVVIILLLQAADDHSMFGRAFDALDKLVAATVSLLSNAFAMKSFTRSWLTAGLMIAYVYVVYSLGLAAARRAIRKTVDFAGRKNLFGLRNAIARERGIEAYRAWEPLEKIRPAEIPQTDWEEQFAWPADNTPPYPSFWRRWLFEVVSFVLFALTVTILLEKFTFIPALTWLETAGKWALALVGWHWWPLGP